MHIVFVGRMQKPTETIWFACKMSGPTCFVCSNARRYSIPSNRFNHSAAAIQRSLRRQRCRDPCRLDLSSYLARTSMYNLRQAVLHCQPSRQSKTCTAPLDFSTTRAGAVGRTLTLPCSAPPLAFPRRLPLPSVPLPPLCTAPLCRVHAGCYCYQTVMQLHAAICRCRVDVQHTCCCGGLAAAGTARPRFLASSASRP